MACQSYDNKWSTEISYKFCRPQVLHVLHSTLRHTKWQELNQRFSHKQNQNISCETSFCQNPSWLLPGLRKMLFHTIYQTDGVLVNVYPNIYIGYYWIDSYWTMTDLSHNGMIEWFDRCYCQKADVKAPFSRQMLLPLFVRWCYYSQLL